MLWDHRNVSPLRNDPLRLAQNVMLGTVVGLGSIKVGLRELKLGMKRRGLIRGGL